jgi:NIPSNAP
MLYNFTVLGLRPNTLGAVMPKLADAITAHVKRGKLIGCFTCDFGVLNRIAILTEYAGVAALSEDRTDIINAGDQYGFAPQLASFEQTAYAPLSFSEPIKPAKHGPFYEIRTYGIAEGKLAPTSEAWAKGISRRNELSKLLAVMASVETVPQRMLHIWPYASLDERAAVRARASKEGLWPPPGGSDHLLSLQSELFLPTAFSPLS